MVMSMTSPLFLNQKSQSPLPGMDEISENTETRGVVSDVEDGKADNNPPPSISADTLFSVQFIQKLIAEFVGTFYMILAGGAVIVVNETFGKIVTLPGIAFLWGLCVMVNIYSVGHVSGAHFNPAVTIAFASSKNFPLKQVPAYVVVQVLASTLASAALRLVFNLNDNVCSRKHDVYIGTYPSGSITQSFVMEFVTTSYLMFVISAVATDKRAASSFAGVAIGSTITLDILFAGPISGASMNPARSLGPAIIWSCYENLWIYIVSPILGAVTGAWTYNMLRHTDKTLQHNFCPSFRQRSLRCRKNETSGDEVCVLRVIDPSSQTYFLCSSSVSRKRNVVCKLE